MNLQRIRQLAGIKLNESIEAVPAIGDSDADMQTAGTVGRNQAYAAYDASQTPATEELELGDDADTELGWYIIRATDGAIVAGPYVSDPVARGDAEGKTWYLDNRNNYSFEYGFDDNGYFVDAELNKTENNDDDWAERLVQNHEKDQDWKEIGSEFDPTLDPKPHPQLTEQKLSRPYMLDRMKKLAGILTENTTGIPKSKKLRVTENYDHIEQDDDSSYVPEVDDQDDYTDYSMRRGEMGLFGDDTGCDDTCDDQDYDTEYDDGDDEFDDSRDDDQYNDQVVDWGIDEGAKVDRFVGHVKHSEEKAGKSPKDAESIAWATANKRGMLDENDRPGGSMKMRAGSRDKMRNDGSYLLSGRAGSYLKGQNVGEVQKQLWDSIRSEVDQGDTRAGGSARYYIMSLPKEQQQKALDYYKMHLKGYAEYDGKHGELDESSPHRAIVQQCMARLQELSDSFVDEEKAFETVEQELIEQGYDDEDIDYIMYAVDQEMNPDLYNDSDHSDDAYALASAGHGSDEDYGYYGGEDDMYEAKRSSSFENLDPEEIYSLANLPIEDAKAKAIEIIDKTHTTSPKKPGLIQQAQDALNTTALIKLLLYMKLKGEGLGVPNSSYSRRFRENFDLNNGYDNIDNANGDDYFPDGADSSVVDATGAAGARQGDNPEQKKMQVKELHKELVYGYRKFLNESGTASKKKLIENQQAVSNIEVIEFQGNVEVDTRKDIMEYSDAITLRATVLDNNNNPVKLQYTVDIYAKADIEWEEYDEPTGWNYGSDEPQHETFAGAGIGDGDISDIEFHYDGFSVDGEVDLSLQDVEQRINPESLQMLLDPNNYTEIIADKFVEEAKDLQPEEDDGYRD